MKSLTNFKIEVQGDKALIQADIVDRQFSMPCQQVTVFQFNPNNRHFIRHVQLSHEAVFIKSRFGSFGIANDDLVDVAIKIEPSLTYAPIFQKKLTNDLKVTVHSEIEPDLQWQVSDDGKEWMDVIGEKRETLDRTTIKVGQFVRCVASGEAGQMISNPVQVK